MNDFARLYEALGNYKQAEPLYQQALAIRRAALGEQHPDYAESLQYLGALCESLGRLAEAKRQTQEALAIRRQTVGEDHPDYAHSLHTLAGVYEWIGARTGGRAGPPGPGHSPATFRRAAP